VTPTGLQDYRFVCDDCGVAVQFQRTESEDGRSEEWDCIDKLRAGGWRVSARYGTLCPECKRKADTGLLDRPIKARTGLLDRKVRSVGR
jgi:hypothetical protein